MPEIAPIVGQPVAYGMALAMLAFYVFAEFVGRYPLTLAHEGGHMLALLLFLRPIKNYELFDDGGGITRAAAPLSWAPSNLVFIFSGYVVPSLLGLGGAELIAAGNAWGVLVLSGVLGAMALFPALKAWSLAFLLPLLVVAGVVWTLIAASPDVRAAVTVGIVWYLLLGGAYRNLSLFTDRGDARAMQRMTLVVPGIVWKIIWIVIGFLCLLRGGRLLLTGP